MSQSAFWSAAVLAVAALGFLELARGLPPETFFVGDPGVKLIAARQAHPDRPFEIPLPTIAGERVPFVEPFFAVHGDHSHAVTSELFPLLSSPFITLFGIRGAYLLPALGFFLYLAASIPLAKALGGRSPVSVVLTAALGTPLLFYGLEFWEHAPAVGAATLATVWLHGATNERGSRGFVAGFLYGLAILLRPEAAWFFVAVLAGSRLLPAPPTPRALATVCLGVLLTLSPLAVYSLIHFGTIVPPHVGSHSALLTENWLATRSTLLTRWFVPDSLALSELWGIALLGLVALGWSVKSVGGSRPFLTAVAAIDIALVALTAPNDGGGQWGPRYVLCAFVPAALLAARFFEETARRRKLGLVTVVFALGMGAWAQREGYRELRGAKLTYGRVLDFVRREVPAQGYAVTDLWWLDQVAAAAADGRQILFAPSADASLDALQRLYAARANAVTIVYSRTESSAPPEVDATCYVEASRHEIPERGLVAIRLAPASRANCPGTP